MDKWAEGKGGVAVEDVGAPQSMLYSAVDFNDIQIPNELKWKREESLSVRTDSFAGGTLKFTGQMTVDSLADFFIATMAENGWKLVGSVRYQNVLLAFSKPFKACTVSIYDSKYTGETSVYIYTTDDIAARTGESSSSVGGVHK